MVVEQVEYIPAIWVGPSKPSSSRSYLQEKWYVRIYILRQIFNPNPIGLISHREPNLAEFWKYSLHCIDHDQVVIKYKIYTFIFPTI